MPGCKSAILAGGLCRSDKYKGISLFKYPGKSGSSFGKSDKEQAKWMADF